MKPGAIPAAIRAGLLIPWLGHPGVSTSDEGTALVSTDKLAQVAASGGCVESHGDVLEGFNSGDQLPASVDRVAADHRGSSPGRERMGRRPRHPLSIELASVSFGGAEHCPRVVGDSGRRHRAAAAGMEDIDAHELDTQQE